MHEALDIAEQAPGGTTAPPAVEIVAAPPARSAPPSAALLASIGESIARAAELGDLATVAALQAALQTALGQAPASAEASGVKPIERGRARRGTR
jgi:hypothetical protein